MKKITSANFINVSYNLNLTMDQVFKAQQAALAARILQAQQQQQQSTTSRPRLSSVVSMGSSRPSAERKDSTETLSSSDSGPNYERVEKGKQLSKTKYDPFVIFRPFTKYIWERQIMHSGEFFFSISAIAQNAYSRLHSQMI